MRNCDGNTPIDSDVRSHRRAGSRERRLVTSGMAREPVSCAVCELHAEAVFRVEGMDCNEEVVILERRLKPLVGMEAVSADVIGQRLHVKYDAAKLTTSAMVDAVGQTGMRMWLEHDEPMLGGAALGGRGGGQLGGGGGPRAGAPPPPAPAWRAGRPARLC